MSYIKKLLGSNETILYRTRRHVFSLLSEMFYEVVILCILVAVFVLYQARALDYPLILYFLLGMLALVLLSLFSDFLRWSSEEYVITSRRVIHCRGVFSKDVMDSSLSKINDVILQQSFLGRIFGYGTIRIVTAADEVINRMERISDPLGFKQAMLNAKADSEGQGVPARPATELMEELIQLKSKGLISEEEFEIKRKEILQRM